MSIPLLVGSILALWVANLQMAWSAPLLQNFCFYGPPVLAVLLIVIPTARNFLKDGQPIVLMLGCAVLIAQIGWVVSSLVFASNPDKFFAAYNFPALLASVCHFVSVAFISQHKVSHGRRGWLVVAGFAGVLAVMGMVIWLIHADLMPVFFIPGHGGTLVRTLTLGAAVVLYAATAGLLWEANRRAPSTFLYWYSMGLALLAGGLTGATLIVLRNSPLHWATRATQVIGTVYMCMAGLTSVKDQTVKFFSIEAVVESRRSNTLFESFRIHTALGWGLRYLFAVMAPMAAMWMHLTLTQRFGPGLPHYILFYPVVMTLAVLGGLGPGLVAMGVSGLLVVNVILPPVGHLAIPSAMDRLGLVIFMGMGLALSLGAEILRRSQSKAVDYDHQKALADSAAELYEAQRLTHIGSWNWDAGTDVTTASEELYHMYGIDPAAEAFPNFQDQRGRCYSIGDWERINEAVHKTMQTGVGYEMDVNVIRDDSRIWVTTRGEAARDAGGLITGLRGTVQDVTERKQAEEHLRKLSQKLSYHVDNSPLAVIEWGPDMRLTRWSGEAERIFGWKAEEVLGKRMEDFRWIYTDDEVKVAEVSDTLQKGIQSHGGSANRNYRKDGSVIDCEWYNSSMLDESGNLRSILSLVLDVTERKRLESELHEQAERKDEFLALLGHELRNPLVPIGNAVYLMRKVRQDPALMDNACTIAERQLAHMTRLVDDLLDVSRIARGKIQLKKEVIDLVRIMEDVVRDYQPVFAENNLTLAGRLPSGPVEIDADKARIVQAVSNLLHNAIKFTDPGGQVNLTVGLQETEWAEVTVKDSGTGIPPEMLATIFEPFTQRRETIGRTRGGLGLGLALATGLVELHGGRISVHSAGHGRGAEFTIRLPLAKVVDHQAHPVPAVATTGAVRKRRILVVEDVPDAATTLRLLLELWGHTVEVAHDGKTGLEKAIHFSPEIILCDIGLPGDLDGYAVARTIRERHGMERVHLIAMTGFGSDGAKDKARQAGFDSHMTKPVEPEALEKTIAGFLNVTGPDGGAGRAG